MQPYEIKPKYPYLTAIGAIAIIGYVVYAGSHNEAPGSQQINVTTTNVLTPVVNRVAVDSEQQYEMVKRNGGTPIELSVKAGLVAEAYLQAHDETNYRKWKEIENGHKKAAGLPQ